MTSSGSQTIGSFTTTENNQFAFISGACNLYGTGTSTAYSLALTVDGSVVAIFVNSTDDDYANYNELRFSTTAQAKIVASTAGSHTLGISYAIGGSSSLKVTRLKALVTLLKR